MNAPRWLAAVVVAFVLSIAGNGIADEDLFLNIYRDAGGKLTPASKISAKAMTEIAKAQGHVTLWLTLNFDYDLYINGETHPGLVAAQEQAVRDGFDRILNPMLASGDVWHPAAGPFIRGPACLIRANAKGVQALVKDDRIWQIVGVE